MAETTAAPASSTIPPATPDGDRLNGALEGCSRAWEMVHRVRQTAEAERSLSEGELDNSVFARHAHREMLARAAQSDLLARVGAAPSASWGAGLLDGWADIFGVVAYLNAVRTVQHYPWEPEEDPTRSRRDDGALAFAAVLRAIHPQVTAAAPEAAKSPRQIGALILEAMHGGPEYAAGFAEALGCWLAGDLEGVPCNLETFDPLAEIQNFADKGVGHD